VHPNDDDMEHISGHQRSLQGPAGQKLDKHGRDMMERHIRFHIASSIEKTGRAQQEQANMFMQAMQPHPPVPPVPALMGPPPPQGAPQ